MEEEVVLKINLPDLTKIPPIVTQILLDGLPAPHPYCSGKMIDSCWIETKAPKERAEAIVDLLKMKGVRAEIKSLQKVKKIF